MALGHPRSIAQKELRLQRGNRRCADVAVINHGETDGQMDDRRPSGRSKEGKQSSRPDSRLRRKEGKSDHQGDREREGESVANLDEGACLPLNVSTSASARIALRPIRHPICAMKAPPTFKPT